jgi:hypothetical protein
VWQTRYGEFVTNGFVYDSLLGDSTTGAARYTHTHLVGLELGIDNTKVHAVRQGKVPRQGADNSCWARCALAARAFATYVCSELLEQVASNPLHSLVSHIIEPPAVAITNEEVKRFGTHWGSSFAVSGMGDPNACYLDMGQVSLFLHDWFHGYDETTAPLCDANKTPQVGFTRGADEFVTMRLDLVPFLTQVNGKHSQRRLYVLASGGRDLELYNTNKATIMGSSMDSKWSFQDTYLAELIEAVVYDECDGVKGKTHHLGESTRHIQPIFGLDRVEDVITKERVMTKAMVGDFE